MLEHKHFTTECFHIWFLMLVTDMLLIESYWHHTSSFTIRSTELAYRQMNVNFSGKNTFDADAITASRSTIVEEVG